MKYINVTAFRLYIKRLIEQWKTPFPRATFAFLVAALSMQTLNKIIIQSIILFTGSYLRSIKCKWNLQKLKLIKNVIAALTSNHFYSEEWNVYEDFIKQFRKCNLDGKTWRTVQKSTKRSSARNHYQPMVTSGGFSPCHPCHTCLVLIFRPPLKD